MEPRQRENMARIASLLALATIGVGQPTTSVAQQVGRYELGTAPASATEAAPTVVLLDTMTGQTWVLRLGPGHAEQWLPLRFWGGPSGALVPLPPSPAEVGNSKSN
jgi:hypothetical protein